jgi:FeS assembly SUF system protein
MNQIFPGRIADVATPAALHAAGLPMQPVQIETGPITNLPVLTRRKAPEIERPAPDEGDPVLAEAVMDAIRSVRDPEIPVNLVDLGLIYELMVRRDGVTYIEMTLTTPACPVAGSLPGQVQQVVSMVPGVTIVLVKLVWTPTWTQARMSDEAKLELGLL